MSKTSRFGWILASMMATGCAASAEDATDSASGAQVAAPPPVTSLNGKHLSFSLMPLAFEAPMLAFAGVKASEKEAVDLDITASSFRLVASDYTLHAVAVSGKVADVPAEVPSKVVPRGVPRIMIFDEDMKELATTDGITLFEHVKVVGNSLAYETTLSSGQSARGQLQLPGLADGSKRYAFTVVPRDVPAGSLFGTHFFKVEVTCKVPGCASPAPGLFKE